MAVDSKHPLHTEFAVDWQTMRHTYKGERKVKEEGVLYLPATAGQLADGWQAGEKGRLSYDAYKIRSSFPDLVRFAVKSMLGVMHNKPPVIELPDVMEPMREMVTLQGESLEMLLQKINEHQLVFGRVGLLLDVPTGAAVGTLPYVAMYLAESIINWDDGTRQELVRQNLNLVVLEESENERQADFNWEFKKKYRMLVLGDPVTNEPAGQGVYQVAVIENDATFAPSALLTPSIGGRNLDEIPFIFINSKDVVPMPDVPPLLGLAQRALTIYRGEADYRQALFMQGQDTLVVIGDPDTEKDFRTGANAAITLPLGGEAKFIGVDSTGLGEMRQALENDKSMAAQEAGQLIDSVSRSKESGDALKIRVEARTATLNQIAIAGAFGLQSSLRQAAKWIGADPNAVTVTPNLDFVTSELLAKTIVEYMTAKALGAPISLRTVHEILRQKDVTQLEFEEELAEIESEQPLTSGSTNEDGPEPGEGEET